LQKNTYLDCGPSEELVKLLAIFMICMYISTFNKHCLYRVFSVILININSLSVSVANRANIVFVISKVLTILTIIIAGLVRIGQGLFYILVEKEMRLYKDNFYIGYTQNLQNGFAGRMQLNTMSKEIIYLFYLQ